MQISRAFSFFCGLILVAGFGNRQRTYGQTTNGAAASGASECKIDREPVSAAEKALSRREYDAALGLYRGMEAASPDASKAGVVRTLLAQGKEKDAEDLAKKWTDAEPQSALAMETWAEVLFRDGQLPEALRTAFSAEKLSPCNARVYLVVGRVQDLAGNHATAARQFKVAHMLAPNDMEIANAWTETQPRSKQLEHVAVLVKDESLLNAKDRKNLAESIGHAKDYSKEDCKLVQPVESAEMHMEEML